jgi:hypothetical protein
MPRRTEVRVDLLGTVEVLHEHLTESLCEEVFAAERDVERRRLWTLAHLGRFWTAVVLRAPQSLRQALAEAAGGTGGYPHVESSPQAFFQRCQDLRPAFFAGLFGAFLRRVRDAEPARYVGGHASVLDRFTGAVAIDGSKLDAVARRLKVCWRDRRVPLPGSLLAVYDLRRGMLAHLDVSPHAGAGEMPRAPQALAGIAAGTLVLGDRAYGVPKFFALLAASRLHGLCRRGARVLCRVVERISETRWEDGRLEDLRVEAGISHKTATQQLRLLRWTRGKQTLELFTDVADPVTMSASEAMALYRERWKVERLFYDLKEVLDLHSFYGANHNVVAMQVYATALVHTAMRVAQSRIAAAARVAPEDLSPAKLFPRVAAASAALTWAEFGFEETRKANPGARLIKPDWRRFAFASTTLASVLVEPRADHRTRRRYCASRRLWRDLPSPRGRKSPQS